MLSPLERPFSQRYIIALYPDFRVPRERQR
jgi:hypothetical protein